MEKIFDESVINMLPLPNGIIIAFCAGKDETRMAAGYKMISFEDGRISSVSSEIYMIAKFGNNYKPFLPHFENPVTCQAAHLSNGDLIGFSKNGDAGLYDVEARPKWTGSLTLNGAAPTGLTVVGSRMWVAFGEANAIVKYNAATMKSELRIGGGREPVFIHPEGMWLSNNRITVCCSGDQKLCRVELDTFMLEDHAIFTEPVHQYFCIGKYELVRLDSGIYLL